MPVTDHVIWLAAVALLASAYLATVKLALLKLSRLAIRQELETRGKRGGAEWLMARFDAAVFATSLFRTVTRLGFFMLVLAEVVELGTDTPLTWTHLLISGVIAVPALWIFTTVLVFAAAGCAKSDQGPAVSDTYAESVLTVEFTDSIKIDPMGKIARVWIPIPRSSAPDQASRPEL